MPLPRVPQTLPSIVPDANVLVEYLSAAPLELTATTQHLKFRDLQRLNELLTPQTRFHDAKPRSPQWMYRAIHFLYQLMLAGRLACIRFRGQRAYLEASERMHIFRDLSPMGKYLSLLEICWTLLDWRGIVQAWNIGIEELRHFQDTFRYLSRKPAGAVVSVGHGKEISIVFWAEFWNYLSFLGFWDLKESAQRVGVEAFSIDEITITKFGAWIMPTLAEERPLVDWNRPLRQFSDQRTSLHSYPDLYRNLQDMIGQIEKVDQLGEEKPPLRLSRRAKAEPDVDTGARFWPAALDETFGEAFVPLFKHESFPQVLPPLKSQPSQGRYTFKVQLDMSGPTVWRRIELSHAHTLLDLHEAILQSVGFQDDHLFAFFMDNKPFSPNRFVSNHEPDYPPASEARIGELNLETGARFLYIFDYGDNWQFSILVESIDTAGTPPERPRIVESFGKSPQQY
jgi:hypothetical protein